MWGRASKRESYSDRKNDYNEPAESLSSDHTQVKFHKAGQEQLLRKELLLETYALSGAGCHDLSFLNVEL